MTGIAKKRPVQWLRKSLDSLKRLKLEKEKNERRPSGERKLHGNLLRGRSTREKEERKKKVNAKTAGGWGGKSEVHYPKA